jgi:hypothetical protein
MAILDILKKELLFEEDEAMVDAPVEEPTEEGGESVKGDAQALVDGMIENAPGSKKQIGIILKYAANSIPTYDIWDSALDYYESIEDEEEGTGDDEVDVPVEEPTEEEPIEEPTAEEPTEDEGEPVSDDDLAM